MFPHPTELQVRNQASRLEELMTWILGLAFMPVLALHFVGAVPNNALQGVILRAGLTWLLPIGQVFDRGLARFDGLASKPAPEIGHLFEPIPKSIVTALYVGGIVVAVLAILAGLGLACVRHQRDSREELQRNIINW